MKRRIGDRRSKPRFEIVGDLWAIVDTTSSFLLQNVGPCGALLESTLPLAVDSVHWVTTVANGLQHLVKIRVRHSTATKTNDGATKFLIGVEFLMLTPAFGEVILRQMGIDGTLLEAWVVAGEFQERRRTPRAAVRRAQVFKLGQRVRVRVVDISANGVLLASDERIPVGSTGRLEVSLGGSQFEAQMQIKREDRGDGGQGHLFGSAVAPSQPRYRDVLDQFLKRAGNWLRIAGRRFCDCGWQIADGHKVAQTFRSASRRGRQA
jgi:hypothetical protein